MYTKTHQIAPFKKISGGHAPKTPLERSGAKRNTSRKRDVYFSPILSPPCLNMDLRPLNLSSVM